jgi:hypothetical protein
MCATDYAEPRSEPADPYYVQGRSWWSPLGCRAEALPQIACTLSSIDVYPRRWADAYNDVHCSGSPANGRQDTPWGLQPAGLTSAASGS